MNLFDKVENVINEWDPLDIFPLCPSGEYRDEILETIELLKRAGYVDEVSKGIERIFISNFGDLFKKTHEDCMERAKQLISLKNE